jgi:hypothetical protein
MLGELIRAVLERALEAELTAHLGYAKGRRRSWDTCCGVPGQPAREHLVDSRREVRPPRGDWAAGRTSAPTAPPPGHHA